MIKGADRKFKSDPYLNGEQDLLHSGNTRCTHSRTISAAATLVVDTVFSILGGALEVAGDRRGCAGHLPGAAPHHPLR
ncbi:unnamed protein product [Parnassius apollo]|uniref:(apollo) hypothetical protein n=1 Tax=Parnassius apollo TaxID=110799 RepID=A0A8S3VZ51_PARAO|nr:unnamed protein product [Parnassius apollo]